MADPFAQPFPQPSEQVIASFSFDDLIKGRRILELFGGKTADRTLLSSFAFYSSADGKQTLGGNDGALDVDFDELLEKQIVLEGRAIVTIPLVHSNSTTQGAVATTMTIQLKKEDVVIVSENATASVIVGNNNQVGQVWTVDFVIPRTTFNKGDTLRITILTTAPGGSHEIILLHDPKDRDATGENSLGISSGTITQPDTTILQMLLPVRTQF